MPTRTPWPVGELARATGLTVRTLHHYEAIGLLVPARSASGHRRYDEAAVQRLYRVCALRSLGVPLAQIRRLVRERASVGTILEQHLVALEERVVELTKLRDRLRVVCRREGRVDSDELLRTIEAMSRLERHAEARRRTDTAESARRNEREWRALGRALRACMNAGVDPRSQRARAIALRARERIQRFAAGDPAIVEALGHVRRTAPPPKLAGWDPPLMRYLDRALRALGTKENGHAR